MDIKELAYRASKGNFSLEAYTKGLSELSKSGLLELLREYGRAVSVPPNTPNYESYQNAVTHHSIGFNAALDLIINFRELVLDPPKIKETPVPTFGAIERAVNAGYITEEEAKKLTDKSWAK